MQGRNCPNCGAALESNICKCPYCGTSYFDISAIDIDGGNHFISNLGGALQMVGMMLSLLLFAPTLH